MKAVIQRVSRASVSIEGQTAGSIGRGLLILLGVVKGDTADDAMHLAAKCAALRIFPDDAGVMNRSMLDTGAETLVVSQFTLAASTRKGNRPSYFNAAPHSTAIPLYELFCSRMREITGMAIPTGRFGADMQVELVNDGPVTIIIDTDEH